MFHRGKHGTFPVHMVPLWVLLWVLTTLGQAGCKDDNRSSGEIDASPQPDGTIEVGRCGDGVCLLKAGEDTELCPSDCGQPSGHKAVVRFFADFPKAPEYGKTVRFTYVVWNEGDEPARNVVLAVPVVLNQDTPVIGDRWWCDVPEKRYACMQDLSYVPGSMRINRVYHPNRARNSYAFIDTTPLTDEPDDDEAYFNADQNFLYLTIPRLNPRSADPEVSGLVWSYELTVDGGVANTPCEDYPLIQNWNYIFADNAEEYTNDIIGHVFCDSPHFHGTIDAPTEVTAGQTMSVTVTMSYDSVVPPPGKDISRFKLLRPRAYVNYPERWLTVTGIDKSDEAEDLKGHDDDAEGGGVIYWARENDDGDQEMLPGESEELKIEFQVSHDLPTGTTLPISVIVRSQRTLPYQNEDAHEEFTAVGGPEPTCGDGACSDGETEDSCPEDCPTCVPEDGVTSFGEPPCCDGLTMIRASHPYSWAYDQCYDWEGGGVPFVQAYCTHCGDGECRGKENPCNCPEDCGPHCGNWVCEPAENRSNCPSDC